MMRISCQTFLAALVWAAAIGLPPFDHAGRQQGGGSSPPPSPEPQAPSPEADAGEPADAPPTLRDARDLLMEGAYQRAIEAYQALSSDPAHAREACIGLAIGRMRIGKYDEAIDDLASEPRGPARAEWDHPRSLSAKRHYVLAQLYRLRGRYEDSLEQVRKAIAFDGGLPAPRRFLGDTLELLGQRDEAVEVYRWFERQLVAREELPSDAEWITETGLGFLRYSVLTRSNVPQRTRHVLHEMLQMAYERLDRSYWPARIAAADLLREKFNNDQEDGSVSDYLAAMRINGNLCEAHVGLGEVALEGWDFESVEEHAESALQVNPNCAPAIHLLAKKLIVERRYDQAIETCERALAINERDVVALSISAGAAACRYDEAAVARMRARVQAVNPVCGRFHRTLGDALGGIRQYTSAEREYLTAVELDPTDANARTELGMLYMQWGREEKARDALDAAWVLDPYNQRTKFTLELLDSLARFNRHETPHFIIRYDADRDPGLGEYFADYLEEVYHEVAGDYATEPKDKTIVELFPTQRAFAVRITGKPWVHTVGACTGRVIAVASPRKSPGLMGRYHLANVLKHEFAHTVTLAATHNRIPHWFTEGLAVMQEGQVRSFLWCELLADAARRDSLFTLESIDWAFMRPKRATDRQMAYAQSEWMCEYIIGRFGYDSINSMLERFGKGQRQHEVFVGQFGLEPDEFDRDFHAWAAKQVAAWGFDMTPPEDVAVLRAAVSGESRADSPPDGASGPPEDPSLLGRLARAEFEEGEYKRAMAAARRAIEFDENERNGLETLAKVLVLYAEKEMPESASEAYWDEAIPILQRLWEIDPTGWTAPKYLAQIALRRKEWDRATEPLKRLQRLCPLDPISWRGLAGIYLERGEDDLAMPQLLELARIEEHDAEVRAEIARISKQRGRLREAQYWYRQALYIDPGSVELHKALGDASMQVGETAGALREYRMLTRLDPANAKHFEWAAFAAHKLGEKDEARALAARAVELDPQSPARSLLP